MHKNNLDRFKRADGQGDVLAGSPRLLESAVETIATTICKNRYSTSAVGPGQVCAGLEQGGKDSCQRDSGPREAGVGISNSRPLFAQAQRRFSPIV